ncbi:hypothetical protein PS15m_012110 [Mucor circinelloides]
MHGGSVECFPLLRDDIFVEVLWHNQRQAVGEEFSDFFALAIPNDLGIVLVVV